MLQHEDLEAAEVAIMRLKDMGLHHGAELVLHGHGHRAHFSEMQTRHGSLPVIAVPSASALGLHGADIAHYNRYRVEHADDGWQLRIEVRRYEAGSGRFTEGEGRTLRIERR